MTVKRLRKELKKFGKKLPVSVQVINGSLADVNGVDMVYDADGKFFTLLITHETILAGECFVKRETLRDRKRT